MTLSDPRKTIRGPAADCCTLKKRILVFELLVEILP
jgi:hypothetical protein